MGHNAVEERFDTGFTFVIVLEEVPLNVFSILIHDVVVPPDEEETVFLVEFMEKPENMTVRTSNVLEIIVLPQLIPIADLNVREPFLVVMSERVEVDFLVTGEIIRPAVVSPMTVTEQDEFGGIIKIDGFRNLKHLSDTIYFRHILSSNFGTRDNRLITLLISLTAVVTPDDISLFFCDHPLSFSNVPICSLQGSSLMSFSAWNVSSAHFNLAIPHPFHMRSYSAFITIFISNLHGYFSSFYYLFFPDGDQ
jgi:hypothetical protein